MNIPIGGVKGEAGESYGSPVTTSTGTFEIPILLVAPYSNQPPIPAGEFILVAHNFDYSIKALTTFYVTASPQPTTGTGQAMPKAVPLTGSGLNASANQAKKVRLMPNILVLLGGLLILATTSIIFRLKTSRPRSSDQAIKVGSKGKLLVISSPVTITEG